MLDLNTFVGPYPFRHIPHPEPEVLLRVLAREGLSGAWVGHLPSAFHRDPSHGNEELFAAVRVDPNRLFATPCIRPDWPDWERSMRIAVERGAVAIRAYPQVWGFAPGDARLRALASACADAARPLILTVRFEDLRQRHSLDVAGDLTGAHIRELARAGTAARIVVTAAGRDVIEEAHWGLTPSERELLFWDISWLWGPPVDELSHLFRTIGASRFVFGSMWPLRLIQTPRANLALLEPDVGGDAVADPTKW
ncbi:MAG: hypothetical protein ACT4P7_22485 [Gemmatimonadaceae bacterium]